MENPAPTTISSSNKWVRASLTRGGFTLIEILIALAIVSIVISMGLPAIERVTYQRLNSTTRKFVGLLHTVRNDAILLNNIYRLAVDMDKNTYWIESQREFKLLDGGDELLERSPKKKLKKNEEPPPSNFSIVQKYSSKPTPLPGGVVFDGLLREKGGFRNKGMSYIHFFPNGFNEQAILYLNKEGSKSAPYSLVLHATLGRIEVYKQKVSSFTVQP